MPYYQRPRLKLKLCFILLSATLALTACGKNSTDESEEEAPQTVTPIVTPGEGDIPPLPPKDKPSEPKDGDQLPEVPLPELKTFRTRSANEFCQGLSDFFQNYAATKLKGSRVMLVSEAGETCRIDSSPSSLNVHTQILVTKDGASLNLAINLLASFRGDAFTGTTLLIDRLSVGRSEVFKAEAKDQALGDVSSLRSELQSFSDLKNSAFRIRGKNATAAYEEIRTKFGPGNKEVFQANPRVTLEFRSGGLVITGLDNSYFMAQGKKASFLRCNDVACLQSGLTYSFEGLDLVVYSKPFIVAGNQETRAEARWKLP